MRVFLSFIVITAFLAVAATECFCDVNDEVLDTMLAASRYTVDELSCNGGYLAKYSEDLSRQWGEIPARKSQIMCQEPGTPTVGQAFLLAWKATGRKEFLDYAKKAADALIWGQHPAGGWHYLIDFDMTSIRDWYKTEAVKAWGWEEYYHYYGNCTFDDAATYAPSKFLLDLYMATLDPAYRAPLDKALAFVLEAQYDNGAWPQRYPLMYDYPKDGRPDYTHYYTFNDGAIRNSVLLLWDAWEQLGDERYHEAAVRGMDFFILSQLAEPQAGWAQQYTMDMKPGWARTYEPAGVSEQRTQGNIRDLMIFATMTGDKRYLGPIEPAIRWLESAVINPGGEGGYTHAGFYEYGTNKPLYFHFEGTSYKDFRYWVDYEREDSWWYRRSARPDIPAIRQKLARLKSLDKESLLAEYAATKKEIRPNVDMSEVKEVIDSLDNKGRWITDMRVRQYQNGMHVDRPMDTVRGVEISVFVRNMNILSEYIETVDTR